MIRPGRLGGELADLVVSPDDAGNDDLGVQATQPQLAANPGIDEPQGVIAEAGGELGAAKVRLAGDLDDGRSQGQAGAGRQVGDAEVEVSVELVTGQLTPVLVPGDEQRGPGVHHGELHIRMRRAIRRARAATKTPGVANEPGLRVECGFGEYFPLVHGRAAHDQLDRAAIEVEGPDLLGRYA